MTDTLKQFYLWLQKADRYRYIEPGSEDEEQIKFVRYLEENGYRFTAIPNSTYTKSKRQKIMNFLMGVRPGLCDLLVILKKKKVLFIEMKKTKGPQGGMNGSVVSKNQKEWIKALNECEEVEAIVCHGGDEAIEKIQYYENL